MQRKKKKKQERRNQDKKEELVGLRATSHNGGEYSARQELQKSKTVR